MQTSLCSTEANGNGKFSAFYKIKPLESPREIMHTGKKKSQIPKTKTNKNKNNNNNKKKQQNIQTNKQTKPTNQPTNKQKKFENQKKQKETVLIAKTSEVQYCDKSGVLLPPQHSWTQLESGGTAWSRLIVEREEQIHESVVRQDICNEKS